MVLGQIFLEAQFEIGNLNMVFILGMYSREAGRWEQEEARKDVV